MKQLKGPLKEVRTCGSIAVQKKGRLMAELVEAHGGIDNHGVIDAKRVVSGSLIVLQPGSQFKGDVVSPALVIKLGARVMGGLFSVPEDPLQVGDLNNRKT